MQRVAKAIDLPKEKENAYSSYHLRFTQTTTIHGGYERAMEYGAIYVALSKWPVPQNSEKFLQENMSVVLSVEKTKVLLLLWGIRMPRSIELVRTEIFLFKSGIYHIPS